MSATVNRQTVKKSFADYAPKAPPQGWAISYTGTLMATLKVLGQLPDLPWKICGLFLVIGLVYTLIHTSIRQASDTDD